MLFGCIRSLILSNISTNGSTEGSVLTRGVVPSMTWNVAEAVGTQRLMDSVVPMVNNPAMGGGELFALIAGYQSKGSVGIHIVESQ